MSRAISPHNMMILQEQQQQQQQQQQQKEPTTTTLDCPPSKRLKTGCSSAAAHHDAEEDDVAALLLSLAVKRSSLDSKTEGQSKRVSRVADQSHPVVSDDEDDDHLQERRAGSKRKLMTLASHSKHQLQQCAPNKVVDWRSFSRPLGPPPRLPMVPAGYVFPPARTQEALNK